MAGFRASSLRADELGSSVMAAEPETKQVVAFIDGQNRGRVGWHRHASRRRPEARRGRRHQTPGERLRRDRPRQILRANGIDRSACAW